MDVPFHYDHADALVFGGALPVRRSFAESAVVILPVPVDRTTSYVGGTRNGPHEILQASSHMELWDEEVKADVHAIGIHTLPEMELPFGEMEPLIEEIERVAYEIIGRDKFLVSLGGEHSITPPLVSAAARKYPGLSVLQIVTDVPHFGGASGSSLEEARSWGKLATDAEQVTVHADATIALPLLVTALAASARDTLARRKPLAFDLGGATMGVNGRPFPQARFEAR